MMKRVKIGFWASATFLFSRSLFDLIICPHSKVEESFQLQATHDLYYYGIGHAVQYQYSRLWNTTMSSALRYDHLQFPGVVPRTFTGPFILSFLCRILLFPCSVLNVDANPDFVQFLARFCLLSLNLWGWLRLALAVDRASLVSPSPFLQKKEIVMTEGSWLLLITACQFHIPFYSSRMLPNSFALVLVLHSYSYWLEKKMSTAIAVIVFGTSVFRCDLLLLLGTIGSSWLLQRELSIAKALRVGITTWVISLVITVPLDSIMWQRPVWPEGEVFYFNVILGKSNEWGLSPWHWYFTSALPKAMLLTIFLLPLSMFRIVENLVHMKRKRNQLSSIEEKKILNTNAIWVERQWLRYIIPVLGFIVLYSFLGHKEIRFIFPALPMLNLGAAIGMSKLTQIAFPPRLQEKEYFVPYIGRVCFGCGLISIGLTLVGSLMFVMVSKENYDGGDALRKLSSHVEKVVARSEESALEELLPHVHIDVAAAMSGVSLFGQRAAQATTPQIEWTFSKDGYEEINSVLCKASEYEQFTHLLSEDKDIVPATKFSVIHTHQGNPRLDIRNRRIVTEDTIFVLEKNGWGNE